MRTPRRRIAVVGCGHGELAIALAAAFPAGVVACFDADPRCVVNARRRAARPGVADRVTLRRQPGALLGSGYDLVVLTCRGAVAATRPEVVPGTLLVSVNRPSGRRTVSG